MSDMEWRTNNDGAVWGKCGGSGQRAREGVSLF
ncbi:hypothetical protein VINI7043_01315 [Vibrio nigripulchritudo ATCC 27043]|nr:hypothetical protein VINI7043_01315 [Vibrio nigripulchritudo ATCC 27043]